MIQTAGDILSLFQKSLVSQKSFNLKRLQEEVANHRRTRQLHGRRRAVVLHEVRRKVERVHRRAALRDELAKLNVDRHLRVSPHRRAQLTAHSTTERYEF